MIKAEKVYKMFDGRAVLQGIDLHVAPGEFVSVMGKSGSGKSTLLNILAGNMMPDGGRVLFDGQDVHAMRSKERALLRRTKLGFVYQSLNLISTLDARDNILLPLYLNRENIKEKEGELKRICAFLGIENLLHQSPKDMSGGERQRVAIAKSLLHSPKLIMLDEPTGNLDSKNAQAVLTLLADINRQLGVSIIQVTHDQQAASAGGRVIEICDGGVLQK